MSRIGVHVVLGPRNGYGEFLRRIANAGQSLAIVKIVDDPAPAQEAKGLFGNRVFTVGRLNTIRDSQGRIWDLQAFEPRDWPSATDAALHYYSLVAPRWTLYMNWIDVWETFNEFSFHWAWQGDFYIKMMELADQGGFKLAHYAFSSGNPPGPPSGGIDPTIIQEITPALREAKRRGHYLSVHEYGVQTSVPFHALRYRDIYRQLPADSRPPLIISECNNDSGVFLGTQALIDWVKWYDSELVKDNQVIAASIFTLGKWGTINFQEALPALTDYIITHPTNPPNPNPCRGTSRVDFPRVYNVIPPNATEEQAVAIFLEGWRRGRETAGGSYDDALMGDLSSRTGNLYGIPDADKPRFIEFRDSYFPGANVVFKTIPEIAVFRPISPVKGIPMVITSPFNAPRDYDRDGIFDDKHEGIDLRAVDSSGKPVPIVASADGVVDFVRTTDTKMGYGIYTIIKHKLPNDVWITGYAHLGSVSVSVGQTVKAGDVLGIAGTSGNSTGIHLHYNIQHIGHGLSGYVIPDAVNPAPLLGITSPPPPSPT